MTEFAATQRNAKSAWVSPYPFEPSNGGLGVRLAATLTSARVALVGSGPSLLIVNDGSVGVSIAFGDATVVATTAGMRLAAGTTQVFSVPSVDPVPTYVAAVTETGTTIIQITRGAGV